MSEPETYPNPGVKFPPPLLFVAGVGSGLLLHRVIPFSLPSSLRAVEVIGGWTCVVAWFLLSAWAVWTFKRGETAMFPNQPAKLLVTWGPYGFSRNPMYVGLCSLQVGAGLVYGSLWPLVLLPAVIALLSVLVIAREERYLLSAFGDDYASYCERVRRFV